MGRKEREKTRQAFIVYLKNCFLAAKTVLAWYSVIMERITLKLFGFILIKHLASFDMDYLSIWSDIYKNNFKKMNNSIFLHSSGTTILKKSLGKDLLPLLSMTSLSAALIQYYKRDKNGIIWLIKQLLPPTYILPKPQKKTSKKKAGRGEIK